VAPAVQTEARDDADAPAGQPTLTRSEALQVLVDRANQGSPTALACLRQLLERCPEVWQEVGDLSRHAELAWTHLIGGDNKLVLEAVKRHVARMKGELAGPAPTPIERLLIEQVALSWLASRYAEIAAATPGTSSLGEAKVRLKRAESAQRRFMTSIKTLTELRAYCTRMK
jgi:hypothetical protein